MIALVVFLAVVAVVTWPSGHPRPFLGRFSRPPSTPTLPEPATPYAVADALVLLALALRSGSGPVEALEEVAGRLSGSVSLQLRSVAAAHRWGLEPVECWQQTPSVWQPAALAWEAALTAGVSPARLLEQAATVIREREARRIEAALARAGVLLVLPLGLAFLPGFVATTVIPVVARLLTDRI